MARPKGRPNKVKSGTAFKEIKANLKYLSFAELEKIIGYANRYKKEKLGVEEMRLIKQREQIEQKIQELKDMDPEIN